MRHGKSANLAADAVKTEVRYMMLTATIEASAHLDVQILYRLIHLKAFLLETLAQLRREPARRGNPQLAGVRSRAGDDIENRACTRPAEVRRVERAVECRQISLANPANRKVLLDGRANRFARELPHDVGKRSQLIGGNVAQRQPDRHGDVTILLLRANVIFAPALEGRRSRGRFCAAWTQRRFRLPQLVLYIARPSRIVAKNFALFENQLLEFLDPQIGYQKLDPCPVAILL